jgi:hypothetical protein
MRIRSWLLVFVVIDVAFVVFKMVRRSTSAPTQVHAHDANATEPATDEGDDSLTLDLSSWHSRGSLGSAKSIGSIGSFWSVGSIGSSFSIGSIASSCSICSIGSFASVGSIFAVGSIGSFASAGGWISSRAGRPRRPER